MAAGNQTLAQMILINNQAASGAITDDVLNDSPLVRAMTAIPASNYNTHVYHRHDNSADMVGYRAALDGIVQGHPTVTAVTETLQILDASFTVDAAIADAHMAGRDAYLDWQASKHLRQAFFVYEQQVLGGTTEGLAAGHTGVANTLGTLGTYCISGGGSTNVTSVYAIRDADPMEETALVVGSGGNISVSEPTTIQIAGSSTGVLSAYLVTIHAYMGIQIGSAVTVARFANIDTTGANLDDDDLSNLISVFPSGRLPTKLVMNRTALRILQQSRTATNPTGQPAPFPQEAFGIPIIVTDAIGNSETAVS